MSPWTAVQLGIVDPMWWVIRERDKPLYGGRFEVDREFSNQADAEARAAELNKEMAHES